MATDIKGKTRGIKSSEFFSTLLGNAFAAVIAFAGYRLTNSPELQQGVTTVVTGASDLGGWLMAAGGTLSAFSTGTYNISRAITKRAVANGT